MNLLAFAMMTMVHTAPNDQVATVPAGSDVARTMTSEEIRRSETGRGGRHLQQDRAYRFVGRIRRIGISDDGLPKITFTGIEAVLNAGYDRHAIEALVPDSYIALECRRSPTGDGLFVQFRHCSNPQVVSAVTAEDYRTAYDRNPFEADARFKDREVVIYGTVRLLSRLNDGSDYVSFATEGGFSDVVGILSEDSRHLAQDYARVGHTAILYCQAGVRWNLAGSIGLSGCRFLDSD